MSSSLETRPDTSSHTGLTTRANGGARTMSIIGFVCAAVAVFLLPIVFGPAAIVLGILAHRKGDPLGKWAAVAGVAGLVVGALLGAMLFAARDANTT